MAFDDTQTEPLFLIAINAIVAILLAPVVGRMFGPWGLVALMSPGVLLTVAMLVDLTLTRRRRVRRGDNSVPKPPGEPTSPN